MAFWGRVAAGVGYWPSDTEHGAEHSLRAVGVRTATVPESSIAGRDACG
jgi:hypothetical protein